MYTIKIFWPHGVEEIKYLSFTELDNLALECRFAGVEYSVR